MAAAPFKLKYQQVGLESVAGTLVAATYRDFGNATLQFDESIQTPGFKYASGYAGGLPEMSYIADTGSTLTLVDREFSAEAMIWLGNMGIKTVLGAASSFPFPFPTTAANSISTFTWEMATTLQEYEFGNGICTNFAIHGDTGANNGAIMYNAKISGRAAALDTVTAGLSFIPNLVPAAFLNINYATIHFDAVGTAAGTAGASAAILRSFSLDCKTGWELRKYADGRSAKDGSLAVWSDYELKGKVKFDLNTAVITRIASGRAATPEIMALKLNGPSSRLVTIKLPISWTALSPLGDDNNGFVPFELDFMAGYSTTSTAQGPSITVTATGSTTVS